jgi:hypothetical protein
MLHHGEFRIYNIKLTLSLSKSYEETNKSVEQDSSWDANRSSAGQ